GGGLVNLPGASLVLRETVIGGNATDEEAAGILNLEEATVRLANCTISGNSTKGGGGGIGNFGTVVVHDSRVLGNSANPISEDFSTLGGGIFCGFGSALTLLRTTVAGNSAST